ncbi:MAG: gfo/Idh/MocA family oxidoreductase, partial [Candidatus Solibacter sp.]
PQPRIAGKVNWTFSGQQYNMYQREHDLLFASIRKGQPMNDGKRMATSTMLGIMGRMAAYTGQEITWDMAMNSKESLFPATLDWKGSLPVAAMAQPGITKFL